MSATVVRKNTSPRDYNIELLRIVLMMMIVYHHFLVHGLGLSLLTKEGLNFSNHTLKDAFIDCFLIMPVNCFVFISGYYGLKFRSRTVVNLVIQTLTYSVLFYVLYDAFFGRISLHTFTSGLFPISFGKWWYISSYFFLYLLSPFLNLAKRYLNKFQFFYVLGILTLSNFFIGYLFGSPFLGLNEGKSLVSFITIYFYGQAFSMYFVELKKSKYFYLSTYLISSALIFLLFFYFTGHSHFTIALKLFDYNNPLVLVSAISFFFFFKNIKISSGKLLGLSSSVLGVYLIHDHKKIRLLLTENLNKIIENYHINHIYIALLGATLILFIAASIIEKLRSAVTDPIVSYLFKRFTLDRFDDRINFVV